MAAAAGSGSGSLPSTYRKLQVQQLSTKFRVATAVVSAPIVKPRPGFVLIKIAFAGINASDINFSAGRYAKGVKPPFDIGAEAVGQVVAVADDVKRVSVGDAVVTVAYPGGFAEYQYVPATRVLVIGKGAGAVSAHALPLIVSGFTALLALEKVGAMRTGETVLVTAAAGGTGQLAVQLAKLAGNTVIGTCSTPDKVKFLQALGCDRVINYKTENLEQVLRREYPDGVDVVYESVGGETFNQCVRCLAVKGRLIIIGAVSGYVDSTAFSKTGSADKAAASGVARGVPLEMELLRKSASVRGFFMDNFSDQWPKAWARLIKLTRSGKLKTFVDVGGKGVEGVADAVDYLYQGNSIGKVVVQIDPNADPNVTLLQAAGTAGKPKSKL